MKIIKLLFISLFLCSLTYSQSDEFDLDQYINFLSSHQNMSTQELLQMYPAGTFLSNINDEYQSAIYFDSIDIKYNLTDYEKSLINEHGFMVTERLSKGSIGQILLDIHHNDLPIFVSTDAILYAFHVSYDRISKRCRTRHINK